MTNIQNPTYYPGDSILHAAGAARKIVLALVCIFITSVGDGIALVGMFFLCHLGMLISGIFFLEAWKRLVALKIMFFVLGVTPLFLIPGTPLDFFSKFSLSVTKEGLECSVDSVSRLACMIWISMILVRTTSPQSLIGIVSGPRSSFFVKGKVLQEFALVGILSFQILPGLFIEAEETIGTSWRQGKAKHKGNRLKTMKEMVRSIVIWVVDVLADPKRVMGSIKKR
jgi:energy-coupling factor transporter transmembrane protein EcfT